MSRTAVAKVITKDDVGENDARRVCAQALVRMGCDPASVAKVDEIRVGIVEDRGERINLFPNGLMMWVFHGEAPDA